MNSSLGPNKAGSGSENSFTKNPSLGLKFFGPLVPANDCKACLGTLAGLQVIFGLALWRRPFGIRSPSRIVKAAGILTGSYLIFMSGIEFARLCLPYDPWVEDARVARRNAIQNQPALKSRWNPSAWRFQWFGPSDYKPVSWKEWQQRTTAFLDKVDMAKPHMDKLNEIHSNLSAKNLAIAGGILDRIRTNTLPPPEIPVHDLEALNALPDVEDEAEFYNEIDLSNADLWDFFEEPQAFSVIVVGRSTSAFLPGVEISEEDGIKSQNVNYLAIPQSVKHELRP